MSAAAAFATDTAVEDFSSIGIYTPAQMKAETEKLSKQPYILQGYIPLASANLLIGDSGIGKSPWCYELGLCVAAGIPFLGIPTMPGRVLYLDYEDDTEVMEAYIDTIARKLGLRSIPDTFQLWTPAMAVNSLSPIDLIRAYRADLAFVDTISTAYPEAEAENQNATELYKQARATGAAVVFPHHKNKDAPEDTAFDRDITRETTSQEFTVARGASALVNTATLRMKFIREKVDTDDRAFIMRSYRRGKGGLPTITVGRVLDPNSGEPIGHYRIGGLGRLRPDQQGIFYMLPERFRWKDLTGHFTGNGPKQRFISACEGAGILNPKKDGEYYVKVHGWRE